MTRFAAGILFIILVIQLNARDREKQNFYMTTLPGACSDTLMVDFQENTLPDSLFVSDTVSISDTIIFEDLSVPDENLNDIFSDKMDSLVKSREVTCILVSHDRTQVMRMTDRVLFLKDGRLIADGPTEEVLDAQSMD